MARPEFDLTTPEFMRDPHSTFARMRARGPVIRSKLPLFGDVWFTTDYQTAVDVLRDQEGFKVDPQNAGRGGWNKVLRWLPKSILALTGNMLGKDEPDHRRLRRLVEMAFVRTSVEKLRPGIARLAAEHVDDLSAAAERSSGRADFVQRIARPYPLAVISELLGFPDSDGPMFLKRAGALTGSVSVFSLFKALPSLWLLNRYFRKQFDACRADDARAGLVAELVRLEDDGDRLSEQELAAMTFLLLFAGHETTTHLLAGSVLTLLAHPEQKARLLADWTLAPAVVSEVMRHYAPVQMTKPRFAAEPVTFGDVTIQPGEICMPLLAAANCDPEVFPEPERFDITRDSSQHLGFGTGMHVCLGMKLATAEVELLLKELFTRFPNLSLAVPREGLKWRTRLGTRGVHALPLALHGAA